MQSAHSKFKRRFFLEEHSETDSGAVTLIPRFGSAANLNILLHCLVLDGVIVLSMQFVTV